MQYLAYLLHILLLRDCVLTLPKGTYYHPHNTRHSNRPRSAGPGKEWARHPISSLDIEITKEIGYSVSQRKSEVVE